MSKRFFTADFHLGMTDILKYEERPFSTIEEMDDAIINMCKEQTNMYYKNIALIDPNGNELLDSNGKPIKVKQLVGKDTIIHVGDLASFRQDRNSKGLHVNPQQLISKIPATFINVYGNHDAFNKVKAVCKSMRITLGKYYDVSISHYPSYDAHSAGHWLKGDIHICGHVHRKWKHCIDVDNKILNINVGVDVWDYKLVSEEQLIEYIDYVRKLDYSKLYRVAKDNSGRYVRV